MAITVYTNNQYYSDIADAIRNQNGTNNTYAPAKMAEAINKLSQKGWQRPVDFPDYSKLDISDEEVLYLTYAVRANYGFICIKFRGATTIDIGTLNNGVYTVLSTENVADNTVYTKLLDNYQMDYIVVRVRPNGGHITSFNTTNLGHQIINGLKYYPPYQSMVEAYGRLPFLTTLLNSFRNAGNLKSVTLIDMNSVNSFERILNDSREIENVDIAGVPTTAECTLYYAFGNCPKLKHLHLHGAGTKGSAQNAFQGCFLLEDTDIESLNYINTGNLANAFQYCYNLKSLNLSGWNVSNATNISNIFYGVNCEINISTWTISGNISNAFYNTRISKIPTASYGELSNIGSFLRGSTIEGVVDLSAFTFASTVTTLGAYVISGTRATSIIIPANITKIDPHSMRDNQFLREFHILATTPPTLSQTNALTTNNTCLQYIYVPYSADHSILQTYQNATNWSTLTQYLVEEPND